MSLRLSLDVKDCVMVPRVTCPATRTSGAGRDRVQVCHADEVLAGPAGQLGNESFSRAW